VPGPAQEVALDPNDLAALLTRLRAHFDLVLVDVGAALPPCEFGEVHLAALRVADLVLVVGALTHLGLSDLTLQTRVLAERLDPSELDSVGSDVAWAGVPAWCVLNKGHGRLLRSGPARVTAATGLPVAASLPLDTRNVVTAEEARLPLTVARPASPGARLIERLAVCLQRALIHVPTRGDDDGRTWCDPENPRRISGDVSGRSGAPGEFPEISRR